MIFKSSELLNSTYKINDLSIGAADEVRTRDPQLGKRITCIPFLIILSSADGYLAAFFIFAEFPANALFSLGREKQIGGEVGEALLFERLITSFLNSSEIISQNLIKENHVAVGERLKPTGCKPVAYVLNSEVQILPATPNLVKFSQFRGNSGEAFY